MNFDPIVIVAVAATLAAAAWLLLKRGSRKHFIVELAGLKCTREDFCRGWLITEDTGSGKTRST